MLRENGSSAVSRSTIYTGMPFAAIDLYIVASNAIVLPFGGVTFRHILLISLSVLITFKNIRYTIVATALVHGSAKGN